VIQVIEATSTVAWLFCFKGRTAS